LTNTIECDDGNHVNGDGCDSNCNIETDWACIDRDKGKRNADYCWDNSPLIASIFPKPFE